MRTHISLLHYTMDKNHKRLQWTFGVYKIYNIFFENHEKFTLKVRLDTAYFAEN